MLCPNNTGPIPELERTNCFDDNRLDNFLYQSNIQWFIVLVTDAMPDLEGIEGINFTIQVKPRFSDVVESEDLEPIYKETIVNVEFKTIHKGETIIHPGRVDFYVGGVLFDRSKHYKKDLKNPIQENTKCGNRIIWWPMKREQKKDVRLVKMSFTDGKPDVPTCSFLTETGQPLMDVGIPFNDEQMEKYFSKKLVFTKIQNI